MPRSLFGRCAIIFVLVVIPATLFAQINVSVSFGPPALPVYEQPPCPAEGYIWTPGYWAYDYDYNDYYWVPGTWVLAPQPGYLWTPGYWGWNGDGYIFHEGYWSPQVGFYGGIDYGYGYFGDGYDGGRWQNDQFYYNRSVNNISVTNIRNVYNETVVHTNTENRISYNGGEGGITARPTAQQQAVARERHIAPVAAQTQHAQAARGDREQRASVNQGKPAVAATPRPGALRGAAVVPAKQAGAPYHPPAKTAEGPTRQGVPRPGQSTPNPGREANGATTEPYRNNGQPIAQPNGRREPDQPGNRSDIKRPPRPDNQPEPRRSEAPQRQQEQIQPDNRPEANRPPRPDNFPESRQKVGPERQQEGEPNNQRPVSRPPSARPDDRPEPRQGPPQRQQQNLPNERPEANGPPSPQRGNQQEPGRNEPRPQEQKQHPEERRSNQDQQKPPSL
jgi:hypothetical protein